MDLSVEEVEERVMLCRPGVGEWWLCGEDWAKVLGVGVFGKVRE